VIAEMPPPNGGVSRAAHGQIRRVIWLINESSAPSTRDAAIAGGWLCTRDGTLDGGSLGTDLLHQTGERGGTAKTKNPRTGRLRGGRLPLCRKRRKWWASGCRFDDEGPSLHHVGFNFRFVDCGKPALTAKLEVGLIGPPGFTGKAPAVPAAGARKRPVPHAPTVGGGSSLRPFTGGRFRHGNNGWNAGGPTKH